MEFAVNGQPFFARSGGAGGGRGFNIAVTEPSTGVIIEKGKNYDTYERGETAGNELSAYIKNLQGGVMLLLAVGDSAGNYGQALKDALADLGAVQAADIGWRQTWAMIAVKGEGIALDEARNNEQWQTVVAEAAITAPGHDNAGENPGDAILIEINSLTPSYLEAGDADVYFFELSDPRVVWLESRGKIDTIARLFSLDSSENIILISSNDQGGAENNFLLQESLPAGTYYIKISGHNAATIGPYDLLVMVN